MLNIILWSIIAILAFGSGLFVIFHVGARLLGKYDNPGGDKEYFKRYYLGLMGVALGVFLAWLFTCLGWIHDAYEYRVSDPLPTLLIDNFVSDKKEKEIRVGLSAAGYQIEQVKKSSLPPGDNRPRFDILSFFVPHFQHLGETGRLEFIFFNDRLMSTGFYPDNYDAYLQKLKGLTKLNFEKDKKISISSNTDIMLGEDAPPTSLKYFRWDDKVLFKEYVDWTLKYAQ